MLFVAAAVLAGLLVGSETWTLIGDDRDDVRNTCRDGDVRRVRNVVPCR
jgi:hypothetical protein